MKQNQLFLNVLILLTIVMNALSHPQSNSQLTPAEQQVRSLIEYSTEIYGESRTKAFDATSNAVRMAESLYNPKLLSDAYYGHGFIYYRTGKTDSARFYITRALGIRRQLGDSVGIAQALNRLGNIYTRLDEQVKALKTHEEALNYLEHQNDFTERGRVYNNIANLYRTWGNYEKALDIYTKALENYHKANYKEGIAWLNFSLTMFYKSLGNYDNALESINKSLEAYSEIALQTKDSTGIMLCYGQLGDINLKRGEYQKGLDYHLAALRLRKKSGVDLAVADGLSGIGQAYFYLGQYETAIKKINESIAIQKSYAGESLLATNYKFLGFIYHKMDRNINALKYLQKGLTIADTYHIPQTKKDILKEISEIYAENGEHYKAYKYQKQYISVTDSIFSSEVANRTASMQILYEMREKEQENILLAQDNRIKKLTIDRSTSIRNMLLIAVFIFIVAIFWVIYLYHQKTESNLLLKQKNNEIEQSHLRLEQEIEERLLVEKEREKLIEDLQESLKKIKTLSGLIPICAHCKNIRNDQGYYEKLEHYIMNHSDIVFSHGICPECASKLYPEFAGEKK